MTHPLPFWIRIATLACGAPLAVLPAAAASIAWTGLGTGGLWSDVSNWAPAQVPADGDDVLVGAGPSFASSLVDVGVLLGTFTWQTAAPAFTLHVAGSGGSLGFAGAGLINLDSGTGVLRQQVVADAGLLGGTIRFTANAGINVGTPAVAAPVDLIAAGAGRAGDVGGRIVFQDASSTSATSHDGLRAEGALVAGAGAGRLVFTQTAFTTGSTTIVVTGGQALGAAGGSASFADGVRQQGLLNVLPGSGGGLGGRVVFTGQAVAQSGIESFGGTAGAGSEAVVRFSDDTRFAGSATNRPGSASNVAGGRLEFTGRAGFDGGSGTAVIVNIGSGVTGALGGRTEFRDDSTVLGTQASIRNTVDVEAAAAGANGGSTEFFDRARAGQVAIRNDAGSPGARLGGITVFHQQASAERASIDNRGGAVGPPAIGGVLMFADDASAGSAGITNRATSVLEPGLALFAPAVSAGTTFFVGRSTAGTAVIDNEASASRDLRGGQLLFSDSASADHATVLGRSSSFITFSDRSSAAQASLSLASDAVLGFRHDSTAGDATIAGVGALVPGEVDGGAFVAFADRASAGNASVTLFGSQVAGGGGGVVRFSDDSAAGTARIVLGGGLSATGQGAVAIFADRSRAGSAAISMTGGFVNGAGGARLFFGGQADAGSARIELDGLIDGGGMPSVDFTGAASAGQATLLIGTLGGAQRDSGVVRFQDTATAANARITVGGAGGGDPIHGTALLFSGAATAGDATVTTIGAISGAGRIGFEGSATAGRAAIVNEAGVIPGTAGFTGTSNAGSARLTNLGGRLADTVGGQVDFFDDTSAANAIIVSAGAERADFRAGSDVKFHGRSSADRASITLQGGTIAGAPGAALSFSDTATAGASTLIAQAGGVAGAGAGSIVLSGQASGGAARVVLRSGPGDAGRLDVSGLAAGGTGVGSIEGDGLVALGGKRLRVGANDAATTFAGVVADGGLAGGSGGGLDVVTRGSLTLTGANTYTGATHIGDGVSAASGKLVAANTTGSATGTGPVFIERGGMLAGSGFIDGAVTLRAGGTLAPGDPVTLTLRDSLTWDGGGVIRLVLGADTAGSDHLALGSLLRGGDGRYAFDLVDAGITPGASYALVSFASLTGFSAEQFAIDGARGRFDIFGGSLAFTAAAVPEPATTLLWLAGLCAVGRVARRRGGEALR